MVQQISLKAALTMYGKRVLGLSLLQMVFLKMLSVQ